MERAAWVAEDTTGTDSDSDTEPWSEDEDEEEEEDGQEGGGYFFTHDDAEEEEGGGRGMNYENPMAELSSVLVPLRDKAKDGIGGSSNRSHRASGISIGSLSAPMKKVRSFFDPSSSSPGSPRRRLLSSASSSGASGSGVDVGDTALHVAVRERDPARVDWLLKQEGVEADRSNEQGDTPLHLAIR